MCVCAHVRAHVREDMRTRLHAHTPAGACMRTRLHARFRVCEYMRTPVHAHACVHAFVLAAMRTYLPSSCFRARMCVFASLQPLLHISVT